MRQELALGDIPTTQDRALNERDYGDLTGLYKDDARARWGNEQVLAWRRSYAARPPGGESLQDTEARVLHYYRTEIEPKVDTGKIALVVAHGSSLRALLMALENLTADEIVSREIDTGIPMIYAVNAGFK